MTLTALWVIAGLGLVSTFFYKSKGQTGNAVWGSATMGLIVGGIYAIVQSDISGVAYGVPIGALVGMIVQAPEIIGRILSKDEPGQGGVGVIDTQDKFESEITLFLEFERFLGGPAWDEIRGSVPEDERNRMEHESITGEIVWNMTELTLDDSEMTALMVVVEASEMKPQEKLLTAHALYRVLQGKEVTGQEISLVGEILGEEFVDAIRSSQGEK
jgi:hypothetical protein